MRVKIYSGLTREVIGNPVVVSMKDARIFLASEFPEHYFGAQLVSDTDSVELIAVKEAYPEGYTAIQAAVESSVAEVKRLNNMYDSYEDNDGVCYRYWKNITLEQLMKTTA